ncbi:MAG: hypothetical protein DMG48_01765 [Acidobacteria bacterium]|nr:MAG: hypothetical protein DMG48_01765 [Acidobacteriota bacterium]
MLVRKPALSGAPLLKSFTTQASVWPASKPIAADNHQPNAGSERMARALGPSLFHLRDFGIGVTQPSGTFPDAYLAKERG